MSAIVYIGAVGRSGTTLLERIIATSPDFVSLGEVVHMWERGLLLDEPCGCGTPFRSCPFWTAVAQRAYGGWDALDLDRVRAWKHDADRNRYIPFLWFPRLAPRRFRDALDQLMATLDPLYAAIGAEVSESRGHDVVLVDASKHPSYYFVLRRLPHHDVRLLHVVRDPRGVAHSWAKKIARPEAGDDMEQLGTLRAVARWTSHNALFSIGGLGRRRARLRYERFAQDPSELGRVVHRLTDDLGATTPTITDRTIDLHTDHTVSGNPMRFRTGPVEIRSDEAWRTAMPRRARTIVSVLTLPQRLSYSRTGHRR